jgi:hypothetical protein
MPVGRSCTTHVTGIDDEATCSRTIVSKDGCATTTACDTRPEYIASRRSSIGTPPTGTSTFGRLAPSREPSPAAGMMRTRDLI